MSKINYNRAEFLRRQGRRILRKPAEDLHFIKKIFDLRTSSNIIKTVINKKEPTAIAKLGETELEVIRNYLAIKRSVNTSTFDLYLDYVKYGDIHDWTVKESIWNNSGFFPVNEPNLIKFSETYIDLITHLDYFGTAYYLKGWYDNKNEDLVINTYLLNGQVIDVGILDPVLYPLENHWIKNLVDKNVLVIHPFTKSIRRNYINKDLIFPDKLLPDFNLYTIKSIQSIAGNKPEEFASWFEALEYMKDQMDNIDFDVALIGAGAYGLPLAMHAKKTGKIGIHIGGALQLYFGILGSRWEQHPEILKRKNHFWTRPLPEEIPVDYKKVGNGIYSYW